MFELHLGNFSYIPYVYFAVLVLVSILKQPVSSPSPLFTAHLSTVSQFFKLLHEHIKYKFLSLAYKVPTAT